MTTFLTQQGASKDAVQHHYDCSNEFYALWLDESRTYSAALFEPGDSLERAQQRKIDHHIAQSRAQSKARVLDVGCGWGATLRRLTQDAGVGTAVGLTLSAAQAEFIRAQSYAGVEVRLESWQDHDRDARYDSVISVGAFEHFARPDLDDSQMVDAYRAFFARCHEWLKPGGYLSLQTIAYGTAKREQINQFILEHIFRESDLPTLGHILRAAEGLFEVTLVRNDREHYAETFREWSRRMRAAKSQAIALVGDAEVKKFETYQGLFTIGFHTGAMQLLRLTLRRLDARPVR